MSETLSPTQTLAEVILERPLAEYVAEKRSARPRWPWKLIAEQLAADTEQRVNVSSEALRGWYAQSEVAA